MDTNLLFIQINKNGALYKCRKGKHYIFVTDNNLNGKSIKKLLETLKMVLSQPTKKVTFEIQSKTIGDDAVIQQLEIIFAHAFENGLETIEVKFINILESSPHIVPLKQSVFARRGFKDNCCILSNKEYLSDYYQESYSAPNYFRYFIKKERRDLLINTILSDALSFFGMKIKDKVYAKDLAKAFTEMIDNVRHADSDCLATIKYCDSLFTKNDNTHVQGYFINVTDVSSDCIFSKLQQAISCNKLFGKTKEIIDKSFSFHKKHFGEDDYSMEKYCFVSVFQNCLTTSSVSGETGGKGLTDLINAIAAGALMNNCYVLSGNHILFFKREFTVVDENGNISFNKDGNYYNSLPSKSAFKNSPFYYPGTIFLIEIVVEDKK